MKNKKLNSDSSDKINYKDYIWNQVAKQIARLTDEGYSITNVTYEWPLDAKPTNAAVMGTKLDEEGEKQTTRVLIHDDRKPIFVNTSWEVEDFTLRPANIDSDTEVTVGGKTGEWYVCSNGDWAINL